LIDLARAYVPAGHVFVVSYGTVNRWVRLLVLYGVRICISMYSRRSITVYFTAWRGVKQSAGRYGEGSESLQAFFVGLGAQGPDDEARKRLAGFWHAIGDLDVAGCTDAEQIEAGCASPWRPPCSAWRARRPRK
jgi:hypothetical protein